MKNRFFKIALETFLGHLGGVGWSPGCEKHAQKRIQTFAIRIESVKRENAAEFSLEFWPTSFSTLIGTVIVVISEQSVAISDQSYYRANDYNINKSKKHRFHKQETTPHHLGAPGTFLEQI